jgi:hypothetical protein
MKVIIGRTGFLLFSLLLMGILFTGCKKETHEHHEDASDEHIMSTDEQFKTNHQSLDFRTVLELLQARWATAKYRNIQNAKDDGYADIDVVVENMGHHYMRSAIVDAKFEVSKPEILVYKKHEDGYFQLVAVEYAVPIEKSPNKAPKGFHGNADVWDRNEGFGLWLLHAWVWYQNPDGVFNPTNPLVHTH